MIDVVKLGIIGRTHGFKGDIIIHTNLTPEEAKTLGNKPIYIERKDFKIQHDEVLSSDLVGFAIVDETGKKYGSVKSIENFGAGDILDCGSFMVPYEEKIVSETNTTLKKIVVKKSYFN